MKLKSRIKKLMRRFAPLYHYFYNRMETLDDVPPAHYLSIACCIKDEGRYLREWIEYHLWAGVDHFYIYDNGSTDNTKEVLETYMQRGIVTYHYWVRGERHYKNKQQVQVYNDAVVRYKHCTKWLAIIDADEFIALSEEGSQRFGTEGGVANFFKSIEKHPAVCINWICFDGGGHETMPQSGYVIENYTRVHKDEHYQDRTIKSVVQPLQVIFTGVHYCQCRRLQKAVDENGKPVNLNAVEWGRAKARSSSIIRINHYYSKSKEEYLAKITVRKWADNTKRAYNQDSWAFPEWKTDNSMKEAAAALRERGVPETYGNSANSRQPTALG